MLHNTRFITHKSWEGPYKGFPRDRGGLAYSLNCGIFILGVPKGFQKAPERNITQVQRGFSDRLCAGHDVGDSRPAEGSFGTGFGKGSGV